MAGKVISRSFECVQTDAGDCDCDGVELSRLKHVTRQKAVKHRPDKCRCGCDTCDAPAAAPIESPVIDAPPPVIDASPPEPPASADATRTESHVVMTKHRARDSVRLHTTSR